MKKIAFLVISGYVLLILVLTPPALLLLLGKTPEFSMFFEFHYWAFVLILLGCELGLLFTPVQMELGRKPRKTAIFIPAILSGFLFGALFFGMVLSVCELFEQNSFDLERAGMVALAFSLLIWTVWAGVFARISSGKEIKGSILRQLNILIKTSFISLLIAVPMHIFVRQKEYCCAGLFTFIGITFGLSVMLLSFGPGIYFLYAQRWKKLHPDSLKETSETSQDSHAPF